MNTHQYSISIGTRQQITTGSRQEWNTPLPQPQNLFFFHRDFHPECGSRSPGENRHNECAKTGRHRNNPQQMICVYHTISSLMVTITFSPLAPLIQIRKCSYPATPGLRTTVLIPVVSSYVMLSINVVV